MSDKNDISWAITFSDKVKRPIEFPPLENMVEYVDKNGDLGELLNSRGSSKKRPKKYVSVTALKELAAILGEPMPHSVGSDGVDKVLALYTNLQELLSQKKRNKGEGLDVMEVWKKSPYFSNKNLILIYERFLDTLNFPLRKPNRSDMLSMLGSKGQKIEQTPALRAAIQLYFSHYSKLDTEVENLLFKVIGHRLKNGYRSRKLPKTLKLHLEHLELLFTENAAEKLAHDFLINKHGDIDEYAERLRIPEASSLYSAVHLNVLCLRIDMLEVGEEAEFFDEIISQKDERINSSCTLGAKALELLIDRCIYQNQGLIPDTWADLVVDLGCHPDSKLVSGSQYTKYWSWASPEQIDVALMAFVRRDLEIVFEHLNEVAKRGQKDGHMVSPRIKFYKALLRNGLIKESRLFLGNKIHTGLVEKGITQFWDLQSADSGLCILALKLADGINMTTGTKSFPIRFFNIDSADFDTIWNEFSPVRIRSIFKRSHFQIDEYNNGQKCIKRTLQGDWLWYIINHDLTDPFLGRVDWRHYNLSE